MLRMIDVRCPRCGHTVIDVLLRGDDTLPHCRNTEYDDHRSDDEKAKGWGVVRCGQQMERVHLGKSAGVIPDDIPGGVLIYNGLCNPDGSPARYYSKTEIAREAEKRGMSNHVVHQGMKSGDRSKHTSRWI